MSRRQRRERPETHANEFQAARSGRLYTILVPALAVAVIGLIALSFVNSYAALERAAVQAQTPLPWLWPLTVDGFLLIMGGFVLVMMFEQRDNPAWVPRALAFVLSIVSGGFSAMAAPDSWDARAINAWPAFAAIFAFEGLVRLLYGRTVPETVAVAPEGSAAPHPPVPSTIPQAAANAPGSGPTQPPPRPRPGAPALSPADRQALDRAGKDPAKVKATAVRRGIDLELVAARPQRWPLPSENGSKP